MRPSQGNASQNQSKGVQKDTALRGPSQNLLRSRVESVAMPSASTTATDHTFSVLLPRPHDILCKAHSTSTGLLDNFVLVYTEVYIILL